MVRVVCNLMICLFVYLFGVACENFAQATSMYRELGRNANESVTEGAIRGRLIPDSSIFGTLITHIGVPFRLVRVCASEGVTVYDAPRGNGKKVATLEAGQHFVALEEKAGGRWLSVHVSGTHLGWTRVRGTCEPTQLPERQVCPEQEAILYAAPESSAEISGELEEREHFLVLRITDDRRWVFVRNGVTEGWLKTPAVCQSNQLRQVCSTNAALRVGPGAHREALYDLPSGTVVKLKEVTTDHEWANVTIDRQEGWVKYQDLCFSDAETTGRPFEPRRICQDEESVKVRSKPGAHRERSTDIELHPNDHFIVTGFTPDRQWLQVRKDSKDLGWIPSEKVCHALMNLNRRVCPEAEAKVFDDLDSNGQILMVLEPETHFILTQTSIDGKWGKISLDQGSVRGWVQTANICEPSSKRRVCGADVDMHVEPNSSSQVVDTLAKGRVFDVGLVSEDREWIQGAKDGKSGWVRINSVCYAGDGKDHVEPEWVVPLAAACSTSEFGYRIHPITQVRRLHTGIDIIPSGSDWTVYAASEGRVVALNETGARRTSWLNGFGTAVVVDHGAVMTMYAHLEYTTPIRVGDWVQTGEPIGKMGSTGMSTGPHLHFELRDPTNYTSKYANANPRTYFDWIPRCM